MDEYILRAKAITKNFAGVQALRGVSLDIGKGEIHCLAGENGSGKSTLIKIISGVEEMNSGELEIKGKSYTKITPIESIRNGIQVIYQDLSVFPNLTVKENLAYNTIVADRKKIINWKEIESLAKEALGRINVNIDLNAIVGDLSIADKQLIAISRALLNNAELIIMDEPTTALTRREINNLFKIIKQLQERGISILFVSHKLDEVFEISDRFTIFRNGENIKSGATSELDDKKFTYYMTGREFEEKRFSYTRPDDTPLLSVKDLTLNHGFSDVSFDLYKGEILGITGLLGSGRAELALALSGYYKPDSGTFRLKGEEKRFSSITDAIASNIGYVPEDRLTEGLFMPKAIGRNIILPKIQKFASRFGFLNKQAIQDEIDSWVSRLAIKTPDAANPVRTLSGGNQQRVVLAKWLAINPEVLILNGPTVGVDIGSKYDIHEVIKELSSKGIGVIVISDDLPEILSVCSRVLIMKAGRVTSEYETADMQVHELTVEMTEDIE